MGNKSKMKRHNTEKRTPEGETVTVKGWPQNRRMEAARQVSAYSLSAWNGVAEKAILPEVTMTNKKGRKSKERMPSRLVYQSDVPFRRRSA